MDNGYELDLQYNPPTDQEAVEWLEENEGQHVSAFACRYPGRYYEAACLLRKVRQQTKEGDGHANH